MALLNLPRGTRSGDELQIPCPNPTCPNPKKFSFNVKRNIGHCYRCDFAISNREEAERVFGTREGVTTRYDFPVMAVSPAGLGKIEPVQVTTDPAPRAYLTQRRVDPSEWGRLFWCAEEGMLYFPVDHMGDGKTSWIRRGIVKGCHWMALPGVDKTFYAFNWKRFGAFGAKVAVLVEGAFDVLSHAPGVRWENVAISTLGAHLYRPQLHAIVAAGIRRVVIWYDPDDAGRHGAVEAKAELERWGIITTIFQWEQEPGDCLERTPFDLVLGVLGA